MAVNLRALIGKLNHTTRSAVESAAGLCLSRTHYDVEIEHYLMKLLDNTDSDFAAILKQYGIDRSRLSSRAVEEPRSSQDRERAHAGDEPAHREDARRGVDDRLARLRRDAGAHRAHDHRAARRTTSSRG